ncbi:MAG: hypothetical protein JXR19_01110 [Bacteroidia bacterium]
MNHINELLYHHNCVIVPDLGGFLIQEKVAQFNENQGIISPRFKTLAFNSQLLENDGLLAHHIHKREGLSYDEAISSIKSFVAEVRSTLDSQRNIDLGALGTFYLTVENNIVFVAKTDTNYELQTYGLRPVKVKTIEKPKKKLIEELRTERRIEKTIEPIKTGSHSRINLKLINVLGSVFILAMVFSLLNVEFSQKGELSFTAQYLDSAFEDLQPDLGTNDGIVERLFSPEAKTPAYGILLNGTYTQAEVENIQQELSQMFAQSEIIEMENNEYTISVISFMNKDLATKYRNLIQKNISYELIITEK